MRRSSILSLAVAVIALAGVVALAFAYENLRRQMAGISADMARLPSISASHEHSEARLAVIKSQLSRVEGDPIVVMGDSIVESAMLPATLCGHPVVNAGIGGATIGFFTRYAEIILRDTKPKLVVLSVGVNDAAADNPDLFRAAYLSTLETIKAPVAIVTMTPTNNTAVSDGAAGRLNSVIENIGGASLIDVRKGMNASMTTDGIHLDGAGYRVWGRALVRGLEARLCVP